MFSGFESIVESEVSKYTAFGDASRALDRIIRNYDRTMLQATLEDEVNTFRKSHSSKIDEHGRQRTVRDDHLPQRSSCWGKSIVKSTSSLSQNTRCGQSRRFLTLPFAIVNNPFQCNRRAHLVALP